MKHRHLIAAAVAGILLGVSGCNDSRDANAPGATPVPDTVKHDCLGHNDCKGQGGCKSDTTTCKGQNACKGQGGCKRPLTCKGPIR